MEKEDEVEGKIEDEVKEEYDNVKVNKYRKITRRRGSKTR